MNPPRSASYEASSDDALVARANAGDRDALEALLRRHHDRVLVLCRRLCRDRGDAEDAAQNALIAIVRGLPRFDGSSAFATWSYRVATNAALDELRRRGRRPLVAVDDSVIDRPATTDDHHEAPEMAAVLGEHRRVLQHALDQLPDEFRIPVVLRDLAELDYAEIAEVLGLAPGTVRSRIARGRAKLAAVVDAAEGTDVRGRGEPTGNPPGDSDVRLQDQP
jgi:RNA polymerase sigma-70 factor (ECF subfamily)